MTIQWEIKSFDELTTYELYAIIQLRLEVFVLEQNVVYQDLDNKDFKSIHVAGYNEQGELVAYLRVIPPGMNYHFKEISLGRVVTSKKVRKEGIGKALVVKGIEYITEHYGNVPIRISAQVYLIKFYSSFGFKTVGEQYTEDDLPHIEMLREKSLK